MFITTESIIINSLNRIEASALKTVQEFQAEVAKSPFEAAHAIESRGRDVLTTRHTLTLVNDVRSQIEYGIEAEEALEKVVAVATKSLISYKPWKHNSTCPISNVNNECEASALADFLTSAERIKREVGYHQHKEKVMLLRREYTLIQQIEHMPLNTFAAESGLTSPRSNASKNAMLAEKNILANWVTDKALDHNMRFGSVVEAIFAKDAEDKAREEENRQKAERAMQGACPQETECHDCGTLWSADITESAGCPNCQMSPVLESVI